MTELTTIAGVGPALSDKLCAAGVRSTEALLKVGSTPVGRARLAEQSGIDAARISKFVNHADLMRIKGVGGEDAELLEAAGVDTVPELAARSTTILTARLAQVNMEKKLVWLLPASTRVADWGLQARRLHRVITY